MANQRLPILRVVEVGSDAFDRYLIKDEQDQLWTGERFTPEEGILYADPNHAAKDIQTILKKNFDGIESVRYVVPLYVEVFSDEPVPVAHVAQYLSRASRLVINNMEHGNGPGNCLVLTRIEWRQIKQIKEFPNE